MYELEEQPTNIEELEQVLLYLWDNLEQSLINDVVQIFPNRLKICQDVYGASISHFLSTGRKEIKETDLFDRDHIPHLLSDKDNLLIYELNLRHNHQ